MNSMQHNTIQLRIISSIIFKTSVQAFEKYLSEQGIQLSTLQIGIMRFISHHPYTLSELSRKMLLDPSTLVPSIDRLVEKGYVIRERDPNDRRRMPLSLTEEGNTLILSLRGIGSDDPLFAALENIGDEKTSYLLELLREIVRNLPEGENILQELDSRLQAYCTSDNLD